MAARRSSAVIGAVLLCLATPALAQVLSPSEIQELALRANQAGARYADLVREPPAPSAALVELREELEATSAELIRTYAIRDQYEKGRIPVEGPDAEATRARILGVLSNTIATLERARAGLAERERRLTHEELVAPVDAARDAWVVATRNRDAELSRYEAGMGPLEVAEIRIEDGSGTVFAGHWTAAAPDSPEAAVVDGLEHTLAATRAATSEYQAQALDFAERVYRAGRAWNWALDLTIARASNRAIRDMCLQFMTDIIDLGLTVSSSGTWSVFRLLVAGIDVGLKINSQRLIGTDLRNELDALGTGRLSEDIKAGLSRRIAEALEAGKGVDVHELLAGEPVAGTALPADWFRGTNLDAVKAGIEGLITFFETNARSRLDTAGADTLKGYERLFLTAVYLGKETDGAGGAKRITTGLSEELGRYGMGDVHPQLETLKGVGISLALDKASGGVKLLWDFFSQANSYSDEELAQRLVFGELEMFILQDAYRQARSRYELAAASEPELVRALDAARHRLRLAATRVFVDEGGAVQDLAAPIRLGHVTGDLRVAVTVSTARVPFLVEVVAEGGEVLARATGPVGSQVTAVAAIPADTLAHALDPAHRLEVSVRVSSTNPGEQDVDGQPSTPAAVDPVSLAWVGWESGRPAYPFVLRGDPFVTPTEAVRVAESPFQGNWIVTHFNHPDDGMIERYVSIYRPWSTVCAARRLVDNCEFELVEDADSGLLVEGAGELRIEGGVLTLEHGHFGLWGGVSVVGNFIGPDALSGEWRANDTPNPRGLDVWKRVRPRLTEVRTRGLEEITFPPDHQGKAVVAYEGWGRGADMRGNRPTFRMDFFGENLWGRHRLAFRDTVGLEILGPRKLYADGAPRTEENVRGLSVEVVIWPGATPGPHTLWLDDQPIRFDFVAVGYPED